MTNATMKITRELFTGSFDRLNLLCLTGGRGDSTDASEVYDSALECELYHLEDVYGLDAVDIDVQHCFEGFYAFCAESLPSALEDAYPDLFGSTGPVRVKGIAGAELSDPLRGKGEVVWSSVSVDADALVALAAEHGITEISDGRGISGFVRTADDEFWALLSVCRLLIECLDDGVPFVEYLAEHTREDAYSFFEINAPVAG